MAPLEEAKQLTYSGSCFSCSPFVTLQLGLLLLQPHFLFFDLRPENRQNLGYIVYVWSHATFRLVRGGLVSSKNVCSMPGCMHFFLSISVGIGKMWKG